MIIIKVICVLCAVLGVVTLGVGYIRYLLIFPKKGFYIFQYWGMKDYFDPDQWITAKKCFKIMGTGLLMVIVSTLILLLLGN